MRHRLKPTYLATAVLLAIAVYHAWSGLVEGELPQFHLAISGLAVILAVVVSVSRVGSATRSAPVRPRTPAQRRTGLLLAASGIVGSILWVTFGPWAPKTDFDIIGFLFVIENIGQIAVLGVLVLVTTSGLVFAWPR
jgi:hypothetical protein